MHIWHGFGCFQQNNVWPNMPWNYAELRITISIYFEQLKIIYTDCLIPMTKFKLRRFFIQWFWFQRFNVVYD